MGRNHFTEASFDVLEAVQIIANEKGCTPAQVALAWCKDRPGVTSPIIGPRTMEQLEDNLGAIGVSLNENDHERLDAVAPPDGPQSRTTTRTSARTSSAGELEGGTFRVLARPVRRIPGVMREGPSIDP